MPVNDNGNEVLRKAAIDNGDNSYSLKTRQSGQVFNPANMKSEEALDNGESFDSGVVDLDGYQFLSTELASDQNGQLVGTWYQDADGLVPIRTFSIPYTSNEELSLTATAILSRYLRYQFTNNSGLNQSRFLIRVNLSNESYSGQILKVEQFIPTNVLSQLTRSVLVGKNPSGVYENVNVNDGGALEVSDFLFGVARGQFPSFSINTKFGQNTDIDIISAPEDVWGNGNEYTGQPLHSDAAETVEVFSSNVNDTSAGTGARTVEFFGLDENFEEQNETITLNGTTPVTSVNTYKRVFTAKVLTGGSGGGNIGTITIRHTSTTANVFVVIPVNLNRSTIAAFTVPAGKTCYIVRLKNQIGRNNGSAGSVTYTLRARPEGGVFQALRSETITTNFPDSYDIKGAIVLQEKTDVKVRVETCSDNNTSMSAAIEYVLVDN